jgi:hypothetical protein
MARATQHVAKKFLHWPSKALEIQCIHPVKKAFSHKHDSGQENCDVICSGFSQMLPLLHGSQETQDMRS